MKKSQKLLSAFRSFLGHMGIYFTVIVMFFNIMLSVLYPNEERIFNTSMFGFILLFSAIFALCDFIMNVKFIESYLAKLSIHLVLTTMDFAVVLAWLSGAASSPRTAIFAVIFYIVAYVIVAAIRIAVHFGAAKKENEKKDYQKLFGENSK